MTAPLAVDTALTRVQLTVARRRADLHGRATDRAIPDADTAVAWARAALDEIADEAAGRRQPTTPKENPMIENTSSQASR